MVSGHGGLGCRHLLDLTRGSWWARPGLADGFVREAHVADVQREEDASGLEEEVEVEGIRVFEVRHGLVEFGSGHVFILVGVSIVVNAAGDGLVLLVVGLGLGVEALADHAEEIVHLDVGQFVVAVDVKGAENVPGNGFLVFRQGNVFLHV